MIIIAGRLVVDADGRDRYLAECVSVVEQARRAPGCLDFAITADSIEPDRINVYERWESDAQLMEFRGSGPDAGQAAQIREAKIHRYLISTTKEA